MCSCLFDFSQVINYFFGFLKLLYTFSGVKKERSKKTSSIDIELLMTCLFYKRCTPFHCILAILSLNLLILPLLYQKNVMVC